jgi:hypothetical protein
MKIIITCIFVIVGLSMPMLLTRILLAKWNMKRNILLGSYGFVLYLILGTIIRVIHGCAGIHTIYFMIILEILGALCFVAIMLVMNKYIIRDKPSTVLLLSVSEYIYFLLLYYFYVVRYLSMVNVLYGA